MKKFGFKEVTLAGILAGVSAGENACHDSLELPKTVEVQD